MYGDPAAHDNSVRPAGGEVGQRAREDADLRPVLPPFRSAGRALALRWEDLALDFVSDEDLDARPVEEAAGERALGEAARQWDEDEDEDGVSGDAVDRLEGHVVAALGEEAIRTRARREDGTPSMSSAPPATQAGYGDGAAGVSAAARPFPPAPGEALAARSAAAFDLTAALLPAAAAPSWLLRCRHVLDRATDAPPHELLACPAVVLLVASTAEPDPLASLAELSNVHHLPRPYHDGRYDPNGLRREFLLLHDNVDGPRDFTEARAVRAMRERFGGGGCAVLRINSLSPRPAVISDGYKSAGEDPEWEAAGATANLFDERGEVTMGYRARRPGGAGTAIRGACLSPADKRAVRRYVANMVATGAIPALERRIAHLNAAVSNAKKGVKNVIKSFWRKPNKTVDGLLGSAVAAGEYNPNGINGEGGEDGYGPQKEDGGARYRHDAIESQARLLADTLFLMRDYEAALSVYRLVKDDYRQDCSHLHHAAVLEMMVLCMYALDSGGGPGGRVAADALPCAEMALHEYARASDEEMAGARAVGGGARPGCASRATRLATRFGLALAASRSLCGDRPVETADLLASASSHETPLGAAVLLEQASAQYYLAGMQRKYGFHMLMAGHMFRGAGGQERHAFRCFAAALRVYQCEGWGELRSHLSSALAAQLYGMGRFALSLQFYARLVGTAGGGRVSVRSQQKFLNHIVSICRDHEEEALVAVDRMSEHGLPRRLEEVLKGSNGGVRRQIELPNIGLPHVQDSSVRVCAASAAGGATADSLFTTAIDDGENEVLGHSDGSGDKRVWQDMTHCVDAEARAVAAGGRDFDHAASHLTDGTPSSAGAPEGSDADAMIAAVLTGIDAEERDAELCARTRRRGAPAPAARATREPLAVRCTLSNPLGLTVALEDVQLVASLERTEWAHTSEFAVVADRVVASAATGQRHWTFPGVEDDFWRSEFLCRLPTKSSDVSPSPSTIIGEDSEPYFVVTKSSVTIETNSDATVTLKLCPLVEGDLRIFGVRFRLLGQVWVYHRFDLKGPLLQDTNANRSKRGEKADVIS